MDFSWAIPLLIVIVMEIRPSVLQQVFQMEAIYENEDYGWFLEGTDYKSLFTTYDMCWLECEQDEDCMSLNYDTMTGKCYFNKQNKRTAPASYMQKHNWYYRTIPRRKPYHWSKMNKEPVCFGAKGDHFGVIHIKYPGTVTTLKLVHISGFLNNNRLFKDLRNKWGAHRYGWPGSVDDYLSTVLTDSNNVRILPNDDTIKKPEIIGYQVPGYGIRSPEIVLQFTSIWDVKSGEQYRLWYGEDLKNTKVLNVPLENDNEGIACVDVYMYGTFDYWQ